MSSAAADAAISIQSGDSAPRATMAQMLEREREEEARQLREEEAAARALEQVCLEVACAGDCLPCSVHPFIDWRGQGAFGQAHE